MSELNNIWLDMTNDDIGFYIEENSGEIPNKRGVYAWFYPLWLNYNLSAEANEEEKENNLRDQIRKIRSIHAYDPIVKGLTSDIKEYKFKWEPIDVQVKKKPDKISLSARDEKIWAELGKKGIKVKDNTRKYTLLGTLFSRPLYIGLADNLKVRYDDHIHGYGDDNDFNKRVTKYFRKLNIQRQVSELLFVCIPFEEVHSTNDKMKNIWRKQQEVVENILKVIGQPMFGAK